MLYTEAMQRTNQLCLTSDMVFMLLLLFGVNSCHGVSNNKSPTTKELLTEAIKEYKTIMDYLAKLLHLLETHRLAAISNASTNTSSLHYSTVKRIPYPMNIHPLLPYQQPALETDAASSPVPPLSPTTPTPSNSPADFTIATPALSYNSTVAPRLTPSSILEVHTSSSIFPITPTAHLILSTMTYSPTVPPIIPTSTVPPSYIPSMSSNVSSRPIISRTSLPSLNTSIIHPHSDLSSNATIESTSSPMYPSLNHSSGILHSFKDGKGKDTEDEHFGNVPTAADDTTATRKEAINIQSKVLDGDGINIHEHWNASLINTSVDDEEKVENDTKVMPTNGYSGASGSKGSLQYEEEMPNSRRQWELSEKREAMTASPFVETAKPIVDETENEKDKETTESFEDETENWNKATAKNIMDETENQKVKKTTKNVMDEIAKQKDKETAKSVMDEIENQEDKETAKNVVDEAENQKNIDITKNVMDETETQEDKDTETEQEDKENENIEHTKHNTISIAENNENLQNDDAKQEEKLAPETPKSNDKEEEEKKDDEDTTKKIFKATRLKLNNTKDVRKKTRKKENLLNSGDDNTKKINETEINEEEHEERENEQDKVDTDIGKQSQQFTDKGYMRSMRMNHEQETLNRRTGGETEKKDIVTHKREFREKLDVAMNERDIKWSEDKESTEKPTKPEEYKTKDTENEKHTREMKGKLDAATKERNDKQITKDKKWIKWVVEDKESSEKPTKPEQYKTNDAEKEKHMREMKGKPNAAMKERDSEERAKDLKWIEGKESSKESIQPEEYEAKDTENETHRREMKGKLDAAMKERDGEERTEDTKWVEGKERDGKERTKDTKLVEGKEGSQESRNPDEYTTKDRKYDKRWTEIKTQQEKERIKTESEDEAELQHKKKMKKTHNQPQESEENEDSQHLKKIKEIQKHDDIAKRNFPYPQMTQYEDENRNYEEAESSQKDILNTSTSKKENKESNSNSTAKTSENKKNTRHGGLMDEVQPPYNVPKQRKRRHVVHVPPTTTPKPSPHLCTKDTPENKHHLCDQLFSALVGVEDMTEKLVREGVTRKGIDHLQEKVWVLGKVVKKIEGDASFFLTMDQQLIVSYIHRLDQTVTKAKQKLESRLAKHRGPSLMLLVALGVGGGLVVLILLVTAALVVARRRQVQREEFYRKQICGEQIPIQSFLDSGHSNVGMTEDEPHTHLRSVLGSRYCQDLAASGCHSFTQEGRRRSKECSTMTTTFDSTPATKATPNSTGNTNHTVSRHPNQPGSAQNHDG